MRVWVFIKWPTNTKFGLKVILSSEQNTFFCLGMGTCQSTYSWLKTSQSIELKILKRNQWVRNFSVLLNCKFLNDLNEVLTILSFKVSFRVISSTPFRIKCFYTNSIYFGIYFVFTQYNKYEAQYLITIKNDFTKSFTLRNNLSRLFENGIQFFNL